MRLDCARDAVEVAESMVYQRDKWSILPDDLSKFKGGLPAVDFSKYARHDRGNSGFAAGLASKEYDDSDWDVMRVPGSWKVQGIGGNGAVWLRCTISIPAALENQELELHLGGVDKHDTTYFNGVQIGATGKDFETQYWDTPRCYKVPAELVKGSKAVIAPYLAEDAAIYAYDHVNISGQSRTVTQLLYLNTPGNVDYISNNTVQVIVTILPEEFVNVASGADAGQNP